MDYKKIGKYELLDTGNFAKLELLGKYKVIRYSSFSDYPVNHPELWKKFDAKYIKNEKGSGFWEFKSSIPEIFPIRCGDLYFYCKLTPFGHIGFFPEQAFLWKKIFQFSKIEGVQEWEALNLFAYSGGSTIACLKAGMKVCHLDSSKGMVEWARSNAELNQVAHLPVRWIVDDVIKFVQREIRRKKKYQGFILDPPSFGRGPKGEVWKIEEDLGKLLDLLMELCGGFPKFIFLSCHTQGYSPLTLERMLSSRIQSSLGEYETGELYIPESSGSKYPSGSYCCYMENDN